MKELYEQDYSQWAKTMADLLSSGNFAELDIENLVEEVRDLSKRERDHLLSSLRLILRHQTCPYDLETILNRPVGIDL